VVSAVSGGMKMPDFGRFEDAAVLTPVGALNLLAQTHHPMESDVDALF